MRFAYLFTLCSITQKSTPLMNAARNGHRDVVELLLEHGADRSLKDVRGGSLPPLCLTVHIRFMLLRLFWRE